jgi:hypothetical protein
MSPRRRSEQNPVRVVPMTMRLLVSIATNTRFANQSSLPTARDAWLGSTRSGYDTIASR